MNQLFNKQHSVKGLLCDVLSFSLLPVEVAALFGSSDLQRGLQLHVARRRSRSFRIFIAAVNLTGEQKSVIREPSLHHSAEALISVNHSSWVR